MREIRFKRADTVRVIAELASFIDSLDAEKEYILTVKEHKQKRSLNSNSYAWSLMDKLAEKLRMATVIDLTDIIFSEGQDVNSQKNTV